MPPKSKKSTPLLKNQPANKNQAADEASTSGVAGKSLLLTRRFREVIKKSEYFLKEAEMNKLTAVNSEEVFLMCIPRSIRSLYFISSP
jgi:hypothetical protein